jgi:hypothetical protein
MMFSDGKWNYVLHPGSGRRIVRAVRADGKEIRHERHETRRRPPRAA